MEDYKWRDDMLIQMTRLATNQENLKETLQVYTRVSEKRHEECHHGMSSRLVRCEKTLYGENGESAGLVEKTRFVSGKWAAVVGLVSFVLTFISSYFLKRALP